MSLALFDKIHNDAYLCDRTHPITIDEFIEFGLQEEVFHHYLVLLQELQNEFIEYGYIKSSTVLTPKNQVEYTCPTLEKLISFCADNHLITNETNFQDIYYYKNLLNLSDAEYYHGYIRYPKGFDEFRLIFERKLSTLWDEESAYITDTFGNIFFSYDECYDISAECWSVPLDSPVRIYECDLDANKCILLKNKDIVKIFEIAKTKRMEIESKIEAHLKAIPSEPDSQNKSVGLPWIKKLYELFNLQSIIENVYEMVEKAATAPEILEFEETDTLYVFCGDNTCEESGHLITNIRVNFHFYTKPDKHYTIQRCAHCRQFQITLKELTAIIDAYGVPRGRIVYDDEKNDGFADFPETTILRDIGYTVSQSAGLTAKDRQCILEYVINSKKMTKNEVLTFLKRRMNYNGLKSGNELAFQKWKEDYNFVYKL